MTERAERFETTALPRAHWRRWCLVGCSLVQGWQLRAEDRVAYKFEDYAEDNGRIHIRTHSAFFEAGLLSWLSLKGNYVYDGISGATPVGPPPPPGENEVPKATIEDIRRAGYVEPTVTIANHTLSPQFSASIESDYESYGLSLSDAIDFNDKNTTLVLGISRTDDQLLPNFGSTLIEEQDKKTTDGLIGVNQLLDQNTVLTANFTVGYSEGYLADPYKQVLLPDYFGVTLPEQRPDSRFRQVGFLEATRFVEQVNGAVNASYRFHHDDWDITAHTISLEWRQKVGNWLTISPLARYHYQTAADFYATTVPGVPPEVADFFPGAAVNPPYYSSDYRLSELQTFTFGVNATVLLWGRARLELGYKRYLMEGLDGVTSEDQYPAANVFSAGLSVWF